MPAGTVAKNAHNDLLICRSRSMDLLLASGARNTSAKILLARLDTSPTLRGAETVHVDKVDNEDQSHDSSNNPEYAFANLRLVW